MGQRISQVERVFTMKRTGKQKMYVRYYCTKCMGKCMGNGQQGEMSSWPLEQIHSRQNAEPGSILEVESVVWRREV